MNSTPCRPEAIIRETALPPPPPTPTTLIRAARASSSANVIRPGPSLWFVIEPPERVDGDPPSAATRRASRPSSYPFGAAGHEAAPQADPFAVGGDHRRAAHLTARLLGLAEQPGSVGGRLSGDTPRQRHRGE